MEDSKMKLFVQENILRQNGAVQQDRHHCFKFNFQFRASIKNRP